jgi:hypothetical protein
VSERAIGAAFALTPPATPQSINPAFLASRSAKARAPALNMSLGMELFMLAWTQPARSALRNGCTQMWEVKRWPDVT